MKKRLAAFLCLLCALITLLVPWTLAANPYDNIYLVGVNDTVVLRFISSELMPVRRGGAIYVPYTVLDNKDLGLSYALNRTKGTFTIFNRERTLIFNLDRLGAEDTEGNTYYNERILSRNGVVFIPLRFVASFFGLSYSFYSVVLPDGTVPIARVCTPQAALGDQQFGASAAQVAAGPLSQYLASQATPAPESDARASAPVEPSPSAMPDPTSICFAVTCTDGAGFQDLLDSFARARVSALFLFSPDDLPARDAHVRAAAAAGHQVGLILDSQDPQGSFRRGNELLGHILRSEATQVAFTSGVSEGNWWVWSGNVTPRGRSVAIQASNLAEDVSRLRQARVTLNDSRLTAQALQRNMTAWSRRPFTLFAPTETD